MQKTIEQKLILLYGEQKGKETAEKLEKILSGARLKNICENRPLWDEKDIALITYPDSFRDNNSGTLSTLQTFLTVYIKDKFSIVHILPFFPYSSDRGFSVIDYQEVKKEFGNWDQIKALGHQYRLMADLVLNHVSIKHDWFQKFLKGVEGYEDYFISFKKEEIPREELKKVFRPRVTPLLTPFQTAKGERWVWTTYSVKDSTDQVDLNYRNPEVLLEIIKIILLYREKGVRIFRLDAAAFIWKEIGTDCKSLPQAHLIIQIFRALIEAVCPSALILTQTSVSFEENISYFGQGESEAHLVYNFPLPPLVLYSFLTGYATRLSNFIGRERNAFEDRSFLNFLDLHDGIGLSGVKGLLSDREVQNLSARIVDHGGKLSYKNTQDGKKETYEMNTTWWSALNKNEEEPFDLQLQKYLTSRAISFAISGIPAVYYLGLFGKENDLALVNKTGINRDINRTNVDLRSLDHHLLDPGDREAIIFSEMKKLIQRRRQFLAFHPNARQEVLFLDKRVFAVLRSARKENQVLALHNVSKDMVDVRYKDKTFRLEPYSFAWAKKII